MRFKHLRHLVIIRDGAEPAVKAREQYQINLAALDGVQHTEEVLTLAKALAGRLCRVDVNALDDPPSFTGIFFQVLLLGFQRKALDRLLLAAHADIQRDAERGGYGFFHGFPFLFLARRAILA